MDDQIFFIRPGDTVLYKKDQPGEILAFIGGSRDPSHKSLPNCKYRLWRNSLDSCRRNHLDSLRISDNNQKAFFFLRANKTAAATIKNSFKKALMPIALNQSLGFE